MTTTLKLIVMLAGAATLTSLSMGTAFAGDRDVRFNETELSSVSGAEKVYSRITAAAIEVCSEEYGGHRLVKYRAERERCIVEVVDEAIASVDYPILQEIHAANG